MRPLATLVVVFAAAVLLMGQAVPTPHPSVSAGAPSDATYITQTADSTLTAEQALGLLSTGLMQVTTTTGAVTSVTTSAGVAALLSDETGSGAVQFATLTVEANTATKTPAATESGEVYTNTGDGDGSAVTLLDDPTVGTFYTVALTVAQTVTVTPNTGETLYLGADQCVASITMTAIGASLRVVAAKGGASGIWVADGNGATCND